jgi:hypothetical protein
MISFDNMQSLDQYLGYWYYVLGLDVVFIPLYFFRNDKQIWVWILQLLADILDIHLRGVLEELFGIDLSNYRIKVLKNR